MKIDRPRLARFVAIFGVVAVIFATRSLVLPQVAEDHDVEVKIESAGDVVGVDIRWSTPGAGEDILTTSLHYSAGSAPSSIITKVHLPDGPYDVAVVIDRASHIDSTRRRITLAGASRLTLPVR